MAGLRRVASCRVLSGAARAVLSSRVGARPRCEPAPHRALETTPAGHPKRVAEDLARDCGPAAAHRCALGLSRPSRRRVSARVAKATSHDLVQQCGRPGARCGACRYSIGSSNREHGSLGRPYGGYSLAWSGLCARGGPGAALARMWNQRFSDVPARSCDDFRSASAVTDWIVG